MFALVDQEEVLQWHWLLDKFAIENPLTWSFGLDDENPHGGKYAA